MAILVCGGAGYIGSHTVAALVEAGKEVVVFDNLSTGHIESIPEGVKFYNGDLRVESEIEKVFLENKIVSVIDFAADSQVGESCLDPLKYYDNNIYGTISLLRMMVKYNAKHIVFSSTAATYGEPERVPIHEEDRTKPTSPYGETKLAVENLLKWVEKAKGITFTALRYFNACGAHISGRIGEDHTPESHLIPIVLQVANGQRDKIMIYGNDYDTPDGTCIRDYLHVSDLSDAHLLALERLEKGNESRIFNLGNGKGFSVKEIIDVAREVTGHPIPEEVAPRRAGDPGILIASATNAMTELDWKPKFHSVKSIIETAWTWHKNNPYGYGESNE